MCISKKGIFNQDSLPWPLVLSNDLPQWPVHVSAAVSVPQRKLHVFFVKPEHHRNFPLTHMPGGKNKPMARPSFWFKQRAGQSCVLPRGGAWLELGRGSRSVSILTAAVTVSVLSSALSQLLAQRKAALRVELCLAGPGGQ